MQAIKTGIKQLRILLLYFFYLINFNVYSQSEVILLWPDSIPGSIFNNHYQEKVLSNEGIPYNISKVSIPTLSVFLPELNKPAKTAIISRPLKSI